ncbi:MAG: Crp/Fnr family transcriptional regulator [Sulfurisoma sp.]|nr:Crp/Fnr family transcriptional regulator [Sulfurisoma sp.]
MSNDHGISVVTLRALPIFHALSDDKLLPIAKVSSLRSVSRHTVVLREGDRTDNVYFVLSGAFKVLVSDEEGREVILSMMGPGDFFGEMGVIDDNPRSATVQAAQPSELVVIAKADFHRFLANSFDVSLYIIRSLVRRLRAADRQIESLALLDVYGRVARRLLDMAERAPDGRLVVLQKVSRQDIAKMIGASREMVSRVMKDLQQHGLVQELDGLLVLREDVGETLPPLPPD